MLGFFKRLFGGRDSARSDHGASARRIEITQDDLASAATLGPKLAQIALGRRGVETAEFDADSSLLVVGFDNGFRAQLSLDNVLATLRHQDGAAQADYIDNLLTAPDMSEGVMLPVLKPAVFIESARAQYRDMGIPDDEAPEIWHREVAPGLVMILVVDTPAQMRQLMVSDVEALGLDDAALNQQLLDNLRLYTGQSGVRLVPLAENGPYQVAVDENYDASMFFADAFWSKVCDELGMGRLVGLFAARNIVAFADAEQPEMIAEIQRVMESLPEDLAYAIMPHQLYLWEGAGWSPMPGPVRH
ncbi:MAG: hypothetical protein Q4G25_10525 [Paracoccus sp. (in: a-proteobacteria)]|nr:hypothetical protein [Paracoccus sp. (in: a-proteobacteria)]